MASLNTSLPLLSRTFQRLLFNQRIQTGYKHFSVTTRCRSVATENADEANDTEVETNKGDAISEAIEPQTNVDCGIPKRGDPVREVDPETSIRYMQSQAYESTYGNNPVWYHYRRNFKGQFAPKLRKQCIRAGKMATGSPCPICRDEYLVLDYRNTDLLEQFVNEQSGEVLPIYRVNICRQQYKNLQVEVMKAKDYGYIEEYVPFREYNYNDYIDSSNHKDS